MKVILLAGGLGTRLSEETELKPKPMVEIGDKPILWHIMKSYAHYGFTDFVICLGYKAVMIKEYFANYYMHQADMVVDLKNNRVTYQKSTAEPWTITLVDTGLNTMTGGRIKRVRDAIGNEPFMLTYGDGVANVDIRQLLLFHKKHGRKATMTAVQEAGRFGSLRTDAEDTTIVTAFQEKPKGDGAWVNGGFFVLQPDVFDYIDNDDTIWERKPLETLAAEGQLCAYRHEGFWQCMDTVRDKALLEGVWKAGTAPWKVWDGGSDK